jgi:hypothetical protein
MSKTGQPKTAVGRRCGFWRYPSKSRTFPHRRHEFPHFSGSHLSEHISPLHKTRARGNYTRQSAGGAYAPLPYLRQTPVRTPARAVAQPATQTRRPFDNRGDIGIAFAPRIGVC